MKSTERSVQKTRVLHIIEKLPLGGAENLLLTLARNIDRSRFDLSVCCLNAGGYVADRLKKEGFRVSCTGGYRKRFFYKKIRGIVRLIQDDSIDIVQTHLINANLMGRICAHLSRVPVVCKTEHAVLNGQWGKGSLKNRAYVLADRVLDRFSDCIIYVSESQRGLINKGRYDPKKQIVVYNAFDEKRFTITRSRESIRSLYGFSDWDIVIGIVGRLVPHKGHDWLFKTVIEVKKKHTGVKMLVVGSGSEETRLKKLAHSLGLDALFLSDRDDIPELMRAMDIFVQPSLREAFGITVAEAMFSRLPIIATNVGGIPEVIKDGETGILVPHRDKVALSGALFRLIENPGLAKVVGERGHSLALSKFSGRRYAGDMERLYISLMEERAGRKNNYPDS